MHLNKQNPAVHGGSIKARKKKVRDDGNATENVEHYIVVVFNTHEDAQAFLLAAGQPIDSRYVNGHSIAAAAHIDLPSDLAAARAEREKAAEAEPEAVTGLEAS